MSTRIRKIVATTAIILPLGLAAAPAASAATTLAPSNASTSAPASPVQGSYFGVCWNPGFGSVSVCI